MPLNIVFLEASKLVSTKTLLLKHYYRRQGKSILPVAQLARLYGMKIAQIPCKNYCAQK